MVYKRHVTGKELYHGVRSIYDGYSYDSFFPKNVKTTREIVKRNNTTCDTIELMQKQVADWTNDTKIIAKILKTETLEETLHNIWDFVFFHFQYKQDHELFEEVRRPARSWADRQSGVDCDCMSVFIASILKNLGIPCFFRRASYNNASDYSHVYVIVPKNKNFNPKNKDTYYAIDAVVSKFNIELNPTKIKDDMADLAALNGIGNLRKKSTTHPQITQQNISNYTKIVNTIADKYRDIVYQYTSQDHNQFPCQVRVTQKEFGDYTLFFEQEVHKIVASELEKKGAIKDVGKKQEIQNFHSLNGKNEGGFWKTVITSVSSAVGTIVGGIVTGIFAFAIPVAGVFIGGAIGAGLGTYVGFVTYKMMAKWAGINGLFPIVANADGVFTVTLPSTWVLNPQRYSNGSSGGTLPPLILNIKNDSKKFAFQMAIAGIFYKTFYELWLKEVKSNQPSNYAMQGMGTGPAMLDIEPPEDFVAEAEKAGVKEPTYAQELWDSTKTQTVATGKEYLEAAKLQLKSEAQTAIVRWGEDIARWIGGALSSNKIEADRDKYFALQKKDFIENKIYCIPKDKIAEAMKPLTQIDRATSSNKADLQDYNMFKWLYGDNFARTGIPNATREGGINMIPVLRADIHEKVLLAESYHTDTAIPGVTIIKVPHGGAVFNVGDSVFLIGTYYFEHATVVGKYNGSYYFDTNQGTAGDIYVKVPFYSKEPRIVGNKKISNPAKDEVLSVIPVFDSVKAAKLKAGDYSYIFNKFASKKMMDEILNKQQSTFNSGGQTTITSANIPILKQDNTKTIAGAAILIVSGWLAYKFFNKKPAKKTTSNTMNGVRNPKKKTNQKAKKTITVKL